MTSGNVADPAIVSAARWFWWIAGLSAVNSVLAHSGSETQFVLGLAFTAIADGVFAGVPVIAWALDAIVVGLFVAFGLFGQRGRPWAFVAGLVIYTLDALIYLRFQDWMPVAFHALALFFIVKGLLALRRQAPAAA